MLTLLMRLAALCGRLACLAGLRGPRPVDVARLFPEVPPGRLGRVARAAAAARFADVVVRRAGLRPGGQSRIAAALTVRGEGPVRALRAAGRPIVFTTWHAGLLHALTAALTRLLPGEGVLILARDPAGAVRPPGFEAVETATTAQRAASLLRAVRHLRAGGVVVLTGDMLMRGGVAQPGGDRFLGRAVRLAPGPAALARLGRAAVVPLAARLEGGRIVAEALAPLEWEAPAPATAGGPAGNREGDREGDPDGGREGVDGGDRALVARIGAAWEVYFRERPEELWVEWMRALGGAAAPGVREGAAPPP